MFFRRKTPVTPSLEARVEALRAKGFLVRPLPDGTYQLTRNDCTAVVAATADGPVVQHPGLARGGGIAQLVDGGFQKFWETPGGRRTPALAGELKELHDFQEDLRAGLGLVSLYNTSLGTTFSLHHYDRLEHRDAPEPAPNVLSH